MPKAKTLQPAPIYSATLEGGNVIRLSFRQLEGKPFDVSRPKRLAELMLAGEEFRKLPQPEFDAALAAFKEAEALHASARKHVELTRRDRWTDHGTARAGYEADLEAAKASERTHKEACDAAHATLLLAFDNRANAEMEFKRNWRAPIVAAQISHHTIGTIDADSIQAPKPKAKPLAASIREIIKEAIDADSALARIAALVNA